MENRRDIVAFQPSDGLDPLVMRKLNHNFSRLGLESQRLEVTLSDEINGVPSSIRYSDLPDKPSIESVTLVGDKMFPQLGIFIDPDYDPLEDHPASDNYALGNADITALWNAAGA